MQVINARRQMHNTYDKEITLRSGLLCNRKLGMSNAKR